MKKLRLKALKLGAREILSREQLKSITGGACLDNTGCDTYYYCYNGHCQYASITPGDNPGSNNPPGSGSTGLGEGCGAGYTSCGTVGCVIIGTCN